MKFITKTLSDRHGEGHINTAVKIIIAVVIGALILGGLYLLFANVILPNLNSEVDDMMQYGEDGAVVRRVLDEDSGSYTLEYSYDNKYWSSVKMPGYGAGASVYDMFSAGDEKIYHCALVKKGSTYYVLASEDGINFKEQFNFTASGITHFYYGTSDGLPSTAGRWEGNKYVVRWTTGGSTYYKGVTSNPTAWTKPTWSEIIPLH